MSRTRPLESKAAAGLGTAVTGRPWWRRWRRLAFAVLAVQFAYVGSYAVFYSRGVSEADAVGFPYFFYVPVADVIEARGVTRRHEVLKTVYEPLNELHVRWFGGRSACGAITFGFSK